MGLKVIHGYIQTAEKKIYGRLGQLAWQCRHETLEYPAEIKFEEKKFEGENKKTFGKKPRLSVFGPCTKCLKRSQGTNSFLQIS